MSYSIYIGTPEDMEKSREIGSFSRAQHDELFRLIKGTSSSYAWLAELEDYEEFVNLTPAEVQKLITEIETFRKGDVIKDNALLNCLLQAGKEAVSANLELMCVGED